MIGVRGLYLSVVLAGLVGIGVPVAATAYSSLASAPTSPQTTMVQIQMDAGITPGGNLGFSPTVVKVVIGVNNTVTWTDNDNSQDANGYTPVHTVSADNGTWGTAASLNPGDTFTYTFTSPGTYPYHCNIHSWMHGTVIVLGTGTSSSSTTQTSSTTSSTSKTTTTPAPEFPLPFVALIAALATCAVVYRLATEGTAKIPSP